MYPEDAVEDEVVFVDPDGAPRVLRGKISLETATYIVLSRRDGDHQVMLSTVRKIIRRTAAGKGLIARAVDSVRERAEEEKCVAFKAFYDTITAIEAARERGDPPEAIQGLIDRVSAARKAWRSMR